MNKTRILIVDDEADFTVPIKEEFLDLGFDVRDVNLGASAPGIVDAWQPDLVLLDIKMPDMSGDEVAEKIRSNPKTKNTSIVFITALETKSEQGKRGGKTASDYMIAKPVSFAELHHYLRANSLI